MAWRSVTIDPPPDTKRVLVRWGDDAEIFYNPCIAYCTWVTGGGLQWMYEPDFVSPIRPDEWRDIPT